MLVSVVVPIYNAALFLRECIESILNQEYKHLELILVENGSTDTSASICDSYDDPRIKTVHCDKCGAAKARNIGISLATGKYICFVDADDAVERSFISLLLREIQENDVELAICNHTVVWVDAAKNIISETTHEIQPGFKMNAQFLTLPICDNDPHAEITVFEANNIWGRMFCLDIILKNGIVFRENLFIREDMVFMYQYAAEISGVAVIGEALYHYKKFSDNFHLSLSKDKNNRYIENSNHTFEEIKTILNKKEILHLYENKLYRAYCSWIIGSIVRIVKNGTVTEQEAVNKMNIYCNKKDFRYGLSLYNALEGFDKQIPILLKKRAYRQVFEYLKSVR